MLIYRATPIRPGQFSPGEMLSQRKYRALLPIHQYLHPNLEISREAQIAQKQAQRGDYDRTAKKLQDLQQLQSVRFQLDPKKPIWPKATVIQQPSGSSPRRYEVQTESGARNFRNSRHIRPAIEIQPEELNQAPLIQGTEQKSPRPGLVKHPSSTAADVADQPSPKPLPKQCVPEKTPVGIALSRPRRAIRPPTRLIEQIQRHYNKSRDTITIPEKRTCSVSYK